MGQKVINIHASRIAFLTSAHTAAVTSKQSGLLMCIPLFRGELLPLFSMKTRLSTASQVPIYWKRLGEFPELKFEIRGRLCVPVSVCSRLYVSGLGLEG